MTPTVRGAGRTARSTGVAAGGQEWRHAQRRDHGCRRPGLPRLRDGLPRRPDRTGWWPSPRPRSPGSTTGPTRRPWPVRCTRRASRSSPEEQLVAPDRRAAGRRGRLRLLRHRPRRRDAQGVDGDGRRCGLPARRPGRDDAAQHASRWWGSAPCAPAAARARRPARSAGCCSTPGLRVALIRHPMPYGDLEAMRVQRFATLADIDASNPTVEEREEYEAPVEMGMVMYAGVDYEGDPARGRAGGRRHRLGRRATTTSRSCAPT